MSDDGAVPAVRERIGAALLEIDPTSIYPSGPVFRCRVLDVEGRPVDAALKRTASSCAAAQGIARWTRALADRGVPVVAPIALAGADLPVEVAGGHWTVYPWVEGREPDGTPVDLAAAGDLLSRLHAASTDLVATGVPELDWPVDDEESITEDVDGIRRTCTDQGVSDEVAQRWETELRAFSSSTLPAIRDAGLPSHPVSLDHRATNLLYPSDGPPVLVDPDNADSAPRLLDLAVSVLLFGSEAPSNPGRLFDETAWAAFRDAYLARVDLSDVERDLWPTAVQYMRLEWGCWHLTEGAEWDLPHQRGYLLDLLTMDDERYPL